MGYGIVLLAAAFACVVYALMLIASGEPAPLHILVVLIVFFLVCGGYSVIFARQRFP